MKKYLFSFATYGGGALVGAIMFDVLFADEINFVSCIIIAITIGILGAIYDKFRDKKKDKVKDEKKND